MEMPNTKVVNKSFVENKPENSTEEATEKAWLSRINHVNDINNLLASWSVVINYLLTQINNNNNNKAWLSSHNYLKLFSEHYTDWIKLSFDEEYLKIIYYMLEHGAAHISGLNKVIGGNKNLYRHRILTLVRYGIIERTEDTVYLRKYRNTMNLTNYHFQKTEFYKLTTLAYDWFKDINYKQMVSISTLNRIHNWRKRIHTSHRRLDMAENIIKKYLKELYRKIENGDIDQTNLQDIELQITELLHKNKEYTTYPRDETPEHIMNNIKIKLENPTRFIKLISAEKNGTKIG